MKYTKNFQHAFAFFFLLVIERLREEALFVYNVQWISAEKLLDTDHIRNSG